LPNNRRERMTPEKKGDGSPSAGKSQGKEKPRRGGKTSVICTLKCQKKSCLENEGERKKKNKQEEEGGEKER